MQLAPVGNDVWVGNFEACNATLGQFHQSIHVWHDYQNGNWRCNECLDPKGRGLIVRYCDGESLATIENLDRLISSCRIPGRLLIHCAMGTYRSPTLAVLAKAVRGCDPFQGMAEVARGTWGHYANRQVPFFNSVPIREIVERFSQARL